MPAGVAYKFQGSQIAVLTDFLATGSPSVTISAITKASPPVVTTPMPHGLADGNIVKLTGIGGMTELNNGTFIVNVLTGVTFELLNINALGYGTYTSGGEVAMATMSNFCELTNYNRTGGTSPEIPTTTICSTAQEFVTGLPDYGTTAIDFNFAPLTTIQQAIQSFYESGAVMGVRIILPDGGGTIVQLGFIQQTNESAGVGGLWTGSITIRNTGPREDFA
jgi:hypothetical protein